MDAVIKYTDNEQQKGEWFYFRLKFQVKVYRRREVIASGA